MCGVQNFFPPVGEGEEEETMAVHEKHLQHQSIQSQLSFEKEDTLVEKKLLDLTYSKLRKLLVTDASDSVYHPGVIPYVTLRITGK